MSVQHAGLVTRACTGGTKAMARRDEWICMVKVDIEYAQCFQIRKPTMNDTQKRSTDEAVEERRMVTGNASI